MKGMIKAQLDDNSNKSLATGKRSESLNLHKSKQISCEIAVSRAHVNR